MTDISGMSLEQVIKSKQNLQDEIDKLNKVMEELDGIEFRLRYVFEVGDIVQYTARFNGSSWRAVGKFVQYGQTDKPCLVVAYKPERVVFVYAKDNPKKVLEGL